MFSTFAALSGLAFFLGFRTTGLAIVVLSILERSPGLLILGWHNYFEFLKGWLVIRRAVAPATLLTGWLAAGLGWRRRAGGPRIDGRSTLTAGTTGITAGGPTTLVALVALAAGVEAAASIAPLSAVDLGSGVFQRRTNLVHIQLDDCAFLAFLGLV